MRFVSSAVPEILGGSQNLEVGYVTQAMLPYDLILYFSISTSIENAYPGLFLAVFGILTLKIIILLFRPIKECNSRINTLSRYYSSKSVQCFDP